MTTLLDTRVVAPSDRPEYWSAGITEHFFPVALQPAAQQSFEARLTGGRVGPIGVRSIAGAPHSATRTARMVAAGDPASILLYLVRAGTCRIDQDDRSCVIGPGELSIHDTSRPSTFAACDVFDVAVFSFPKWMLGARGNTLTRCTATRLGHGDDSVVRLGAPFLSGLARTVERAPIAEHEADGLAEMLVAMLRTLHAAGEPAGSVATGSGALLERMRRYALEHLHDPQLGPEQIARAHHYSTRYVHKLFAAHGSGVSAWIREQRLERALADLRCGDDSVAVIATRWGYGNAASFSRAFRQRYGDAPTDRRCAG